MKIYLEFKSYMLSTADNYFIFYPVLCILKHEQTIIIEINKLIT